MLYIGKLLRKIVEISHSNYVLCASKVTELKDGRNGGI